MRIATAKMNSLWSAYIITVVCVLESDCVCVCVQLPAVEVNNRTPGRLHFAADSCRELIQSHCLKITKVCRINFVAVSCDPEMHTRGHQKKDSNAIG